MLKLLTHWRKVRPIIPMLVIISTALSRGSSYQLTVNTIALVVAVFNVYLFVREGNS